MSKNKDEIRKATLSTAGDFLMDDPDNVGTYLPKPIADEIIEYITERNYCRQLFRTVTMMNKTLDFPVITSGRATKGQGVYYVPSQIDITDKAQKGPKVHSVRLTAKKLMAYANIDEDHVEDSAVDVIDLLLTSFAEAFAEAEERAMLIGDAGAMGADDPASAWNGLYTLAKDASLTVTSTLSATALEVSGIEEAISLAIRKLDKYGRDKGKLVCFISSDIAEAMRRSKRLVNLYQLAGVRDSVAGEAIRVYGVKLYESAYLDELVPSEAAIGIAVLVPKDEPIVGDRRKIKIKTRELIEHDKKRYVISERLDFAVRHTAYSSNVSGNAEAVAAIKFDGAIT